QSTRRHVFIIAGVVEVAVTQDCDGRTAVGKDEPWFGAVGRDALEMLRLCPRETPLGVQTHPVSATRLVNVGQLAVWINFPNAASAVDEINNALLVHNNAGSGMS